MKKLFVLISALLCIALFALSAGATENVVFVAAGGTGDGSSAQSPLGSLASAFTAVGDGGTVVLTSDLTIGAAINLPDHTGTVTLTSVYGGVDYRATNDAALRYTASARLVLGGPTIIDYFDIEIDQSANGGAVLAADFNDLTIGYNVDISYNYAVSGVKMYVIGGPNNDATGNILGAGESCTIEIYSGAYEQVVAFSRSVANVSHNGTVYMTLGGNVSARLCFLGAVTTGAKGGSCEITLKENAKATWFYPSGNASSMNGSVTVNVKDNATISNIDRYADSLFPNGTKTINLYGDSYTVPANLEKYFNTVNTYEEEPLPPVVSDTVFVADGGTGDGMSESSPTGSLANAYASLKETGGTITLVSDTTLNVDTTFADMGGNVTFNAKNGSTLKLNGNISFSNNENDGTVTFDLPVSASNAAIFGAFNDIVFTENFAVSGTLDFFGGVDATNITSNALAITEKAYSVTVNGGTFNKFALGNYRSEYNDTVGSIAAPVTLTVNGGTFNTSFCVSGMSILADNASISISGGTFNCPVFVQGGMNSVISQGVKISEKVASDRKYYAIDGDITLSISGGTFNGGTIGAYEVQPAYTQVMRGNYTVSVTGGTFAENTVFDATQVKAYAGSDKVATITYPDTYTFNTTLFDTVNGTSQSGTEPIRIAFVGDSITEGYTVAAEGVNRLTGSYPALIASLAKSDSKNVVVSNYGISSAGLLRATAYYYPNYLAYNMLLEETDADYIVIAIGVNDNAAGGTTGAQIEFETNYRELIETVGALPNTDKVFITNAIFWNVSKLGSIRAASVIRPTQEKVAKEFESANADKYVFVDLYGLTLDAAKSGTLLSSDNLHPSKAGFAKMADVLYGVMFENAPATTTAYKSNDIYISASGSAFGSGTKDDPISHIEFAFAKLPLNEESTVHIVGKVPFSSSLFIPVGPSKLTIVGEGDGAILENGSVSFKIGCDVKFDNITLATTAATEIYDCYNDIEMTDTVTLSGNWSFFAGHNIYREGATNAAHDTVASASGSNDCNINISANGTFTNFALGNRRCDGIAPIGTYSGNLTAYIGNNVRVSGTNIVGIVGQNYLAGTVTASIPSTVVLEEYASIGTVTSPIVYDSSKNTGSVSVTSRSVIAPTVAYVSYGASGSGASPETPAATLAGAYAILDTNKDCTIVLMSDYPVNALTNLPAHGATVTITSVYGGVDYRTTNNAALRYTKTARIVLGGDTIIDDLNIEIDSTANDGAVIAANFHDLKIGYGVEIIHNYTPTFPSRMFIIGGSNNDANGNGLAAGETSTLEIYSGDYMQVTAFSRGTANKAHYGTVNLKIGGDATVYETYLGAVTTGASGGTVNLELKENAKLNGTGLFLSGNAGNMNGDVTVNVSDNAEITSFGRYAANLHAGTKTINVYGEEVSVPSSLETYFDVVNVYIPKDRVTVTESFDVANIVSVAADGEAITADITKGDNGITFEYTESLENFTLAITVKDTGYTVYEYTVTETDGTANATLANTKTYAGDVIYVGAKDGNGLTPETPVSSFAKAYEMLIGNGGTFVVCDEVDMATAIFAPEHTGTLTVTSVYGGVDYRESGAKLAYATSTGWQIGGETIFENLTFDIDTTAVVSGAFHPLTFDEGIEIINDYSTDDGNGLYLIGGHNKSTNALAEYPDDTSITVRSGHIRCIIGFSRHSGARVHTGTANINVEGTAYLRYIFGGATQSGSTAKNAIITVADKAIVENIYTGGSASDNLTTGEVIIDVTKLDGGDIYEFDTISIDTSNGKVKVHYDPRTVSNGIVTMATMAQFEALSTCDRAGAHTFGEAYANPFGGDLTAHTCKICDYTCLIEAAPEKVAEGVVFVADGGFGNGLNPLHPFGNLEDAFTALGNDGGTVVLVGECTLPVNLEWKFGASHVSFQEPNHTGNVLVTSVYGDVDYRESGAKLIFDGDMHYRLSGPTTFDNIVFDTVNNTKKTNLVAARYNPLVFGENCKMNKTSEDGYQFWVVGGYQYFRYTDFIGVEIEDRFLDMVTPARQKAWDWQPEDLVEFTYTSGSGKTHNIILQKDAAEAFQKMFADMEKEGLYVPYPSWRFRSAHTQYGIFSDSVGNQRVLGKNFDDAYIAIARSASPAGSSEHQLGLAFDIEDERLLELYPGNAHGKYDTTAEWQWIVDNGPKYGIIHRFLKNKSNVTGFIYEAWHFRYVGVEHAMAIAETDGYCLEEYVGQTIGLFDQNSSVTVLSGDFYQVMGGSRGCDNLTFTGTRHVTVGENANVISLVDVDAEVGEVIDPILGDVNNDETVTLIDVLRIFKYVIGEDVEINTAVADINGDNTVNVTDALLVLKNILN